MKIIAGMQFERLMVKEKIKSDNYCRARWLCTCQCGKTISVLQQSLIAGQQSCGCLRKELQIRHNAYGTPIYQTWISMIQRCRNQKNKSFKHYGGRGIIVCERWKTAANFIEDMGPRPEGMTLERINNDRGYEPGNCKWASPAEQTRNNRQTKLTKHQVHRIREFKWAGASAKELAVLFDVTKSTIFKICAQTTWKDI
jgi:hypothetical protein